MLLPSPYLKEAGIEEVSVLHQNIYGIIAEVLSSRYKRSLPPVLFIFIVHCSLLEMFWTVG